MIDFHTFSQLRTLSERDRLTAGQIAASLGLNVKTVRRWLKAERYAPRYTPPRAGGLDPYKPMIQRWLERHAYSAAQILRLVREQGYGGGYTVVKDYVRRVRPPARTAYLTLAFAPGECAQIDWGTAGLIQVGNTRRRLHFFVMVLCYSRLLYVWFSLRQSLEHFLSAQRQAFEFFGGVPARVMVDNCKTAVLTHPRGEAATLNPHYLDFARHYGFQIAACNVRAAHEKGRVENAIGYVRKSLLNGLDLASVPGVQLAAEAWRDQVANVRVHGQTGKRPLDLFQTEKPHLLPLPLNPYDCGVNHTVGSDRQFRVRLDSNRYSVPAQYASMKGLILRAYPDRVLLYCGQQLLAEHARSYGRRHDHEHPDHAKPLEMHRLKAREQALLRRFLALGPIAQTYHHGLCERRLRSMDHVRQILSLADVHGTEAVLEAMADAAQFHAFSGDCVLNLLEQHARHQPQAAPLHLTRNQDLLELELEAPDLSIYPQPEPENPS
jgi:transposase